MSDYTEFSDDEEADGLVPDEDSRVEAAGIDPDFPTTQEETFDDDEDEDGDDDEITLDELP